MFTGLIKAQGILLKKEKAEGGFKIVLSRPSVFSELEKGESIALDGICLTLEQFDLDKMEFFVGLETLARTDFLSWKLQRSINLEQSLKFGDRLGGHMVSGHVDGVALVSQVQHEGPCLKITVGLNKKHHCWIVQKGSLCVNGVSLTINQWDPGTGNLELFLIPESLRQTNLGNLEIGSFVNIECDSFVKTIVEKMQLFNFSMPANVSVEEKNELHL